MSKQQHSPLIHFGVGNDGELYLAIAEELWTQLQAAARADQGPEVVAGWARVRVSQLGPGLSFSLVAAHQEPPCPPFT